MITLSVPNKNQIKTGSRVWIETKRNQGRERLTEGIVKKILTRAESHPYGIMVMLDDGQTGRVKRIDQAKEPDPPFSGFVDLRKIEIPDKESMKNEFKETFAYDRKRVKYAPNKQADNKKKYNGPQELAKEICAFGNSDGGFVFLGVGDDGNVVGLEEDRKMTNCADYEDKFANHMRSKLESLLNDKAFFGSKIRYVFRNEKDKTVCIMQVLPASNPIYVGKEPPIFYIRGPTARAQPLYGDDLIRYTWEKFSN